MLSIWARLKFCHLEKGYLLSVCISEAPSIQTDIFVIPTMNAVFALAEGIHRTLQMKCGFNYTGVCSSFISDTDTYARIMDEMDSMDFRDFRNSLFQFVEREANKTVFFTRFISGGIEIRVNIRFYWSSSYNNQSSYQLVSLD